VMKYGGAYRAAAARIRAASCAAGALPGVIPSPGRVCHYMTVLI
jgi:hypothetical protein